jgi:hypothetical protein
MTANNELPTPDEFDPSHIIMPAHFAAPHEMPVHAEVTGAYDERGVWWIILRVETVHGSHITFLTPETARVIANELGAARAAAVTTPFVPGSPN